MYRRIHLRSLFCLVLLVGLLPGWARNEDAASVIAKHIEAHGGRELWTAAKAMKLSGDFTSYSLTKPFTLYKTQAGQLFFDHHWSESKVVAGIDASGKAWWFNTMVYKIPNPAPDFAIPSFREYGLMITPFLDYQSRGEEVTFLGEQELEGAPYLALSVKSKDGREETWYLDPTTYLEAARVSAGSDFGETMPETTWFDDFRDVKGLKLAHTVEITYGTRHWVMEVKELLLNPEIDPAVFEQPWSDEMSPFKSLVGEWDVKGGTRGGPKADWEEFNTTSTITSLLDHTLLMEQTQVPVVNSFGMIRQFSYDPYNKTYLIQELTNDNGLMKLHKGTWKDKELSADTLASNTTYLDWLTTYHGRIRLTVTGPDQFVIEKDLSTDGKNWFTGFKFSYQRKGTKKP